MSFDRVARVYRLLERVVYRGALQQARVAYLNSLTGEPRVLVLGDGDGRFLAELVERLPGARIDVVEASSEMIELAKARLSEASLAQVKFECADVFEFFPTSVNYDLVVSHFFLDCFQEAEVQSLVELVYGCMKPSAEWLIADFQIPQGSFLQGLRARFLLWMMYRFFRLTTQLRATLLVDPEPILASVGLFLGGRVVSNGGFLRADRWVRKD